MPSRAITSRTPKQQEVVLEIGLRIPCVLIILGLCSMVTGHTPPAPVVHGTVVNQAGKPPRGLTAMLISSGVRDTVDSLGRFTLTPRDGATPSSPLHDVLVFARDSRPEAAVRVTARGCTLRVMLDLQPDEIVAIATSQLGRGPRQIGTEQTRFPFDLGRYLGPNEAWCSEFVSWVYTVAGYPLGERPSRQWLIRSSRGLRRWFTRNARFVPRDAPYWETASPAPGDYIRYDNARGGHSGIVCAVRGTTLYTIEGNVRNRVVRRTIRNWRSRRDIDGIGLRSGVHPRTYTRHATTKNAHTPALRWVPLDRIIPALTHAAPDSSPHP